MNISLLFENTAVYRDNGTHSSNRSPLIANKNSPERCKSHVEDVPTNIKFRHFDGANIHYRNLQSNHLQSAKRVVYGPPQQASRSGNTD